MQLTARVGAGHQLEEVQELAVAMAGMAGVSHLPGGHLQRGKQGRGAVPDVVVGTSLNSAWRHRPDRLGALQRLDLALLVPTQHDRVRRGSRYSPTTSRTRASSWGSVENLKVSVCQGLTSCSAQTLATVLWPMSSSAASSREDQWVTPRCSGWRGQRGGQDLGAPIAAHGLGPASSRPVGQASSQSFPHIALTPGDHGGARDPKPLGDLAVGDALGSQQQDPGPLDQHRRGLSGVGLAAQDRLVTGADGKAAAEAGIRRQFPYALHLSNQLRDTPLGVRASVQPAHLLTTGTSPSSAGPTGPTGASPCGPCSRPRNPGHGLRRPGRPARPLAGHGRRRVPLRRRAGAVEPRPGPHRRPGPCRQHRRPGHRGRRQPRRRRPPRRRPPCGRPGTRRPWPSTCAACGSPPWSPAERPTC
jgi:hypothetical protein